MLLVLNLKIYFHRLLSIFFVTFLATSQAMTKTFTNTTPLPSLTPSMDGGWATFPSSPYDFGFQNALASSPYGFTASPHGNLSTAPTSTGFYGGMISQGDPLLPSLSQTRSDMHQQNSLNKSPSPPNVYGNGGNGNEKKLTGLVGLEPQDVDHRLTSLPPLMLKSKDNSVSPLPSLDFFT